MAQSSVKSFFPTRKRPAVDALKAVSSSPKALLLDDSISSSDISAKNDIKIVHVTPKENTEKKKLIRYPHVHHSGSGSASKSKVRKKLEKNYPIDKTTRDLKSFLKPATVASEVSDTESLCKIPTTEQKEDETKEVKTETDSAKFTDSCLSTSEIKDLLTPDFSVESPVKDEAEHTGQSTLPVSVAAEEAYIEEPHSVEQPSTPQETQAIERPSTPQEPQAVEQPLTPQEPQFERPSTPENSPSVARALFDDLGLNDLKVKVNRSKRYNALKDSLQRFQSREARLKDIASRLQSTSFSSSAEPSVGEFSSFEIEVPISPLKSPLKPQRLFTSPTKSPRKGLITPSRLDFSSPVKNVYVSPRKFLEERPSPVKVVPCHLKFEALVNGDALILPFKYRSLFEIFCAVDTVSSLFHNRNEKITFTKLKSGVQEMLRRNFSETHLAQIKTVLPTAFQFSQEKYQIFGKKSDAEYHLIVTPVFSDEKSDNNTCSLMNPSVLAARKSKFNKSLLEITKRHHRDFLLSLDPPLDIPTDKVTRWHAEFEVNAVPDIPLAELPPSPAQTKKPSAKDVLENAKSLLSANSRVTAAIDSLSKRLAGQPDGEPSGKPLPSFSVPCHTPGSASDAVAAVSKALKGVPQSLLDKIKAKQAARAVEAMTRSPAQNKKAVMMSRLPEIARIVRNLFVVERKSVLPIDQVITKLQHSCRENLTPSEIKAHLLLIQEHAPEWMSVCVVRNLEYVKLLRAANVEAVMLKLKNLVENEGRIYHCR